MKRFALILLMCFVLLGLSACGRPNTLQMDISQGFGQEIKLIHLNASSKEKKECMDAMAEALADCSPIDKDISLFAYYPDYKIELSGKELVKSSTGAFEVKDVSGENGVTLTVIVDVNGDFVDFYFPEDEQVTIYRSNSTAADFRKLVHRV